jgi:hypothetical protein
LEENMQSIPLVLVVYENPEDGSAGEEQARRVMERHPCFCPFDIEALHVLGVPAEEIESLRESFSKRSLREQTQRLLRRIGQDGEALIRREEELHFVWTDSLDPEVGRIHLLFVVPSRDLAAQAGLCLEFLRADVGLN